MKKIFTLFSVVLLGGAALLMPGCSKDDEPSGSNTAVQADQLASQLKREAWYNSQPESRTAAQIVTSDCMKLEFFGWGESEDKLFNLRFTEQTDQFDRVILEYRMGGWNEGPADWDNTTMLFIKNKADGEWYEIARAFTPYGGGFANDWEKIFYLDVTEYLPMLRGDTQFRLYYGGFDANDKRAHTLTLTFKFYEGTPKRNTVYTAKVYDSSRNGNSGYRGYAYGVPGHDIEASERMGQRAFAIPDEVKAIELRVAISGHGHDKGDFPDRSNYRRENAAEFVENSYTILINGVKQSSKGRIFYSNADNYFQYGTYKYDRANWAPGNPLYVHYWSLKPAADKFGEITLNIDLERFISTNTEPNAEGVAQYIVEVDLFGFDR